MKCKMWKMYEEAKVDRKWKRLLQTSCTQRSFSCYHCKLKYFICNIQGYPGHRPQLVVMITEESRLLEACPTDDLFTTPQCMTTQHLCCWNGVIGLQHVSYIRSLVPRGVRGPVPLHFVWSSITYESINWNILQTTKTVQNHRLLEFGEMKDTSRR